MSAVADVLKGAADLIERDGWCQGQFYAIAGSARCVDGAIMATADISHWRDRRAARLAVRAVVGQDHIDWNDTPGRTKAEVVAALRTAAEKAS